MRRVGLVQVGIGTVGGAVVQQVIEHGAIWRDRLGLDIRLVALAGTGGALIDTSDQGIAGDQAAEAVARRTQGSAWAIDLAGTEKGSLAEALDRALEQGEAIVLDASAGEQSAPELARALDRGAGVVLSNKAPMALPRSSDASQKLWAEAGPGGRLRYEATCGAGLPVISTLRSLLDTGDEVIEIQGALSGTFGAIFSSVADGLPFSEAVRLAKSRGYTEPDPRDDLSGLDVARKALILARSIGRELDLSDVTVESLVPAHLAADRGIDVEAFLERVRELDGEIADRAAAARQAGQALKYVAQVPTKGAPTVGLQAVDRGTVLGALQGPENILSFRTRRYDQYPTVISGPGAGAAVTAAGMLVDALALATGPLRQN